MSVDDMNRRGIKKTISSRVANGHVTGHVTGYGPGYASGYGPGYGPGYVFLALSSLLFISIGLSSYLLHRNFTDSQAVKSLEHLELQSKFIERLVVEDFAILLNDDKDLRNLRIIDNYKLLKKDLDGAYLASGLFKARRRSGVLIADIQPIGEILKDLLGSGFDYQVSLNQQVLISTGGCAQSCSQTRTERYSQSYTPPHTQPLPGAQKEVDSMLHRQMFNGSYIYKSQIIQDQSYQSQVKLDQTNFLNIEVSHSLDSQYLAKCNNEINDHLRSLYIYSFVAFIFGLFGSAWFARRFQEYSKALTYMKLSKATKALDEEFTKSSLDICTLNDPQILLPVSLGQSSAIQVDDIFNELEHRVMAYSAENELDISLTLTSDSPVLEPSCEAEIFKQITISLICNILYFLRFFSKSGLLKSSRSLKQGASLMQMCRKQAKSLTYSNNKQAISVSISKGRVTFSFSGLALDEETMIKLSEDMFAHFNNVYVLNSRKLFFLIRSCHFYYDIGAKDSGNEISIDFARAIHRSDLGRNAMVSHVANGGIHEIIEGRRVVDSVTRSESKNSIKNKVKNSGIKQVARVEGGLAGDARGDAVGGEVARGGIMQGAKGGVRQGVRGVVRQGAREVVRQGAGQGVRAVLRQGLPEEAKVGLREAEREALIQGSARESNAPKDRDRAKSKVIEFKSNSKT